MTLHNFIPAAPLIHSPAPSLPQAHCMRTGGSKSILRDDMITQTYNQFNKSALICVHLRLFLVDNLQPLFKIEPAPASDSAGFLTHLEDIFIKINNSRRCEN